MMDVGQPDQKRPRLERPPPPGPWPTSQDTSRQLPSIAHNFPPPPQEHAPPYQQHGLPFSSRTTELPQHLADRRTSEHAPPPPPWEHPDHRRPGSGPAHGFQPGPPSQLPPFGGPRETMVKRDPSEDTPQHQYRPNSTGHGPEHSVSAPHHEGAARSFHPPPYDPTHARPQSYASYPQPHTGSPVSTSNPYSHLNYGRPDLPPPPPPPPDHQYSSVTYPVTNRPTAEQVRKKAQRAAQACDSCRTLKAKCDEGRPSCSSCKEKGAQCNYRDPPPKQQDKTSADIIDGISRIENGFSIIHSKFDSLTTEMNEMKRVQKHILQNLHLTEASLKEEVRDEIQMPSSLYSRGSVTAESQVLTSNESPYGSTPGPQRIIDRMEHQMERMDPHVEQTEAALDDLELPQPINAEEEEEESGADPGPPKDSSIPINHTTGAARLLLLGPIAEMCKDSLGSSRIKNEKYPIQQETRRGMLRLFGRGEGGDFPPGYDKDPSIDHGDNTPGDAESNASTPPAGEEWGQLGGLTPPGNPTPEITRGGISPEGMPDLSRATCYELARAYLDNINIMHPILNPNHLHSMVEIFLKHIPEDQAKPRQVAQLAGHPTSAGFIGGGGFVRSHPESPGTKRKRSPVSGEYSESPISLLEFKPFHPFRTINTAIVLLVLALGKICLYKGRLPDIALEKDRDRDRDSSFNSSPTMRNGHLHSPIQTSPMGIPSPSDMDRMQSRSRRTSIEGANPALPQRAKTRNLDVMPGLSYFALATDILGNQLGGNSLQHVHAYILAGLYHAQLARIMESSAYIANASRILQVILRPKLDRFKKTKQKTEFLPAKDNPLVFAFWTCLQLESDIVAELPCPHSGILTYEEDMPGPNLQAACDEGFDQRIIESYSAQLFLRKHLNQLHNMFYKPDDSSLPVALTTTKHFPTIEASQESLDSIDKFAPNMVWDIENGELATDILGARLRAKYYGAQVITYRPFVINILEMSSAPSDSTEHVNNDEFLSGVQAPRVARTATTKEDIPNKVLQYAKYGLQALIHSTRAFYGVGRPEKDRLIVTNIWGTAHAQWGNLLVLQAAWKNRILRGLLDELITTDKLVVLLEKTLGLLKLVATPTSALAMDYQILKRAAINNGLLHPQGPNTSSSFSSTATGDATMGGH